MDRIPLHWIFVLLFLFHNILYFWKTPNFLQLYEWVSLHLIAFHPGIIVTTPCAAYALDRVVPSQRLSELPSRCAESCRVRCAPSRHFQTRGCTGPFSCCHPWRGRQFRRYNSPKWRQCRASRPRTEPE